MAVGFSRDGARRVIKTVQHVEGSVRGGRPGRGRYPVLSPSGLILCRIGSGGLTARVGGALGTGTVTRYEADEDGANIDLAAETEPATSSYYAIIDGDADGWFTVLGGKLSLVTRHCLDG